ncbi:Rrf2 family transcriptional regulator [Cellulomonas sp. URHD0024]|uniref:Rrf2 family transcriptional regulator n=1 Tax=Cellulomonas sp. URHD0024 TaxID=1302620 RepID=UPI0004851367|nr:Rrf2 family transcriptional regulator [Cellulomonas sp. URHD0024]
MIDPVVAALVDLLEQAESVNPTVRTPGEVRTVGRVLGSMEVAVLAQITRVAAASADEIARSAALPVATVNKALRSLQQAGLVESTRGPRGHLAHRATAQVPLLREAARTRAARQVTYGLSALTSDERALLEAAAPAVAAFTRALGLRDIHPDHDTEA